MAVKLDPFLALVLDFGGHIHAPAALPQGTPLPGYTHTHCIPPRIGLDVVAKIKVVPAENRTL